MLFRALGTVSVETDQGLVPLGGRRSRRLLAALLVHAGRAVPVDELIDRVWLDEPPRTAAKTLQTHILNLRQRLGADRILTHPSGYAVRVGVDEYDVPMFEAAVERGRTAVAEGDWETARICLRDALSLWRGEPFADLAIAVPLKSRLIELRGYAVVDLARAEISLEDTREAVSRLRSELVTFPLREELWATLMLALHRSGRSGEALEAFADARSILREELGADPGEELRAMHATLLAEEPGPATGTIGEAETEERSRVRYAASGGGLVSYQVLGDGDQVLLLIPDWFNAFTALRDHPAPRQLIDRLASGRRVLLFDTIGMGRSDLLRGGEEPSIESWVRDALAVLDEVRVDRCSVLASSVGAAVAIRLAAENPRRIERLVLHNPVVRTSDTPLALVGYDEVLRLFQDKWATGAALPSAAPSRVNDDEFNAWFGRFMATSVSAERLPSLLTHLVFELDVMADAPRVRCPILITARRENVILGPDSIAILREHLPSAELRSLQGGDHLWFIDDPGDLAAAVEDFFAPLNHA